MAQYRIICTIQQPFYQPHSHAHIVKAGTGADSGYSKLWTVADIYNAMDRGDTFYTQGKSSGKFASVHKYQCTACNFLTIRSAADAVYDNNLDNLPTCQ